MRFFHHLKGYTPAKQGPERHRIQTFSGLPKPEPTQWMILNVAENSGGKSEKRCVWKQKAPGGWTSEGYLEAVAYTRPALVLGWNLAAFQAVADQAPLPGLADEIITPSAKGAEQARCCNMFLPRAVAFISPNVLYNTAYL
ncbi:hypothetical protein Celaphus_00012268 [Cervus elaphus hippelaphus]|uniref:Uncharacterized protein n=1 Tax=Cervus elaphus hippelaphus TaxID=46360 RepID=A0A212CKE4_CEREH|nr:hypothetical protein Celaphus_00012268 [Cervus elaphus hippelaphus]